MEAAKKNAETDKPGTFIGRTNTDNTIGQIFSSNSFIPPSLTTEKINEQSYPNTNADTGNKYPLSWEFIS